MGDARRLASVFGKEKLNQPFLDIRDDVGEDRVAMGYQGLSGIVVVGLRDEEGVSLIFMKCDFDKTL